MNDTAKEKTEPAAMTVKDLWDLVYAEWYGLSPEDRLAPHAWVMDIGWYRRVRAAAAFPGDEGTSPEEWEPGPNDWLFGIPVTVTGDGGKPHLVVTR